MRIRIEPVSRVFLSAALVHFLIGTTLGALMASNVTWWDSISPYHAELNPFGWLTFLIYGMTYAVLQLFASLRVPWKGLPWIHFVVAEAGVLLIIFGYLAQRPLWIHWGWVCQTSAGILFLIAVMSAVVSSRRSRKLLPPEAISPETPVHVSELDDAPPFTGFYFNLEKGEVRDTDRVAKRGTSLALIVLIVATLFATMDGILHGGDPWLSSKRIRILLFDGWIAGTVLAVSLHLLPRYRPSVAVPSKIAHLAQSIWFIGILLAGILPPAFWLQQLGTRVIGLSFAVIALLYLRRIPSALRQTQPPVKLAWTIAWAFAFILGTCQTLGLRPLSLPAIHLLFLGWITTLVYGVGYVFFPLLLHRFPAFARMASFQVLLSTVGAVLLIIGMVGAESEHAGLFRYALAIGGSSAMAGFFLFALQWSIKRKPRA
ncbi:hypothetical protein [Ferroacidibacillus organovorans]|uniref:Cytochrome oxidase subunit I profile domain-containing protein n=1 Tax=Ferroacidibacillus organovorans TaxID=1765683 RepID=A0A101XPU2_9BACL|nr:hypothetical protein [Ferroacidibacillus organovorans]KUO95378.1 hypothetical protein ATW55_11025 [Ferroacidibacillus organovorans]